MNNARIYQPDKTAMQSGKGNMKRWKLEFVPDTPYFIDSLMGWTGMTDTTRQLDLSFPSKEVAVKYAEKNHIPYEIEEPHARPFIKKSYADNFISPKPGG